MEGREIFIPNYLRVYIMSVSVCTCMSVFVCVSVYCFIVCANVFRELKVSSLCYSWKHKLSHDLSALGC